MNRFKLVLAGVLLSLSTLANAQLIYGNTFPFWNVNGPLNVTGLTTFSGGLTLTGTTSIAAPTISGTMAAASGTFSGTLGVTGVTTLTAQPILSSLTASQIVLTDSSKGLVSGTQTGTGTVFVAQASPTLTGTLNVPIVNITTTASPAAADACTAGRFVWDASYVYVCTATGVWKRAALTGGY